MLLLIYIFSSSLFQVLLIVILWLHLDYGFEEEFMVEKGKDEGITKKILK